MRSGLRGRDADTDWLFLGDSITAVGVTDDQGIDGGIGGTTTADAIVTIDAELARFSGRCVAVSFGSNDADEGPGSVTPARFAENYAYLVAKLRSAGKTPVVPTIP